MKYSPQLMEAFLHPQHAGRLENATSSGIAHHPTCGDTTRIFLRVEDGKVADASFQASGCGPGIACASVLLQRVVGQSVTAAASFTAHDVASALDLPAAKHHCAELAVGALRQALDQKAVQTGGDLP